ncbi:hypothetical protein HLB23_20520 [Nocardia uniformis]|uniref:Uncharacterized protein n=1 Tax=Nocardia uniformis TaxID=53432 RepID=A0A849C0A7_9NOCA|nr:hypothetical protein [Nocardia uniformis]NNH72213.1 hypothetical protein [Nocardia uniformis]
MSFVGRAFGSSRERFGRHVLELVRGYDGIESAAFDSGGYVIDYRVSSGGTGRIGLGILFRRFDGQTGPELASAVADLVEPTLVDYSPGSWGQVAARLRPVLRQAGREDMRFAAIDVSQTTLSRPTLPYLAEMVVVDMATTLRFVTTQDLDFWGVDADHVYTIARGNLTVPAMNTLEMFEPSSGIRVMEFEDDSGDSYIGSLPLLPGWLGGVATRTGSRPLVFLPGHTGMFVVLGASEDMLVPLLTFAEEHYDKALRPLSPVPYTVDARGELAPLQVPRDHLAWRWIRHAEARLAASSYATQTAHLRSDEHRAEAVAELVHLRAPDGIEHTMTSWTDYAPTLLPRAHYICFVSDDHDAFRVEWDVVATLVNLTPAPGYDPPRYRVESHPPAEIMARLRALAS